MIISGGSGGGGSSSSSSASSSSVIVWLTTTAKFGALDGDFGHDFTFKVETASMGVKD